LWVSCCLSRVLFIRCAAGVGRGLTGKHHW
jgi:hypothetical protein